MLSPMRPEILFPLFAPITSLKGVGARIAPLLERVAGPIVRDLLFLKPQGLMVRTRANAAQATDGAVETFEVEVDRHFASGKIGAPYKIRVRDDTGFLHLVYFKGIGPHLARLYPPGAKLVVSGRVERYGAEVQIAHPAYVLPVERAAEMPDREPVYPATAGLPSRTIRRLVQLALERTPELPEWQDPAFIARRGWPSWREALERLHAPQSEAELAPDAPARQRLAYDELLAHQLAMVRRKAHRRAEPAPVIESGPAARAVEAALPFALTGAQQRDAGRDPRRPRLGRAHGPPAPGRRGLGQDGGGAGRHGRGRRRRLPGGDDGADRDPGPPALRDGSSPCSPAPASRRSC